MASLHLIFSHTWTRKLSKWTMVRVLPLHACERNHSWTLSEGMYWAALEKGFQLNHEAAAQPFCPPGCSQQVDWDKIIAASAPTHRILFYSPAWCCQKLFQLLTGYRATLRSQTGRFCQENCTSCRVQACSITLQHWKWFRRDLLCSTLWDFQAQQFCLQLSFDSFLVSNAHFWEDVAGVSPPGRDCC